MSRQSKVSSIDFTSLVNALVKTDYFDISNDALDKLQDEMNSKKWAIENDREDYKTDDLRKIISIMKEAREKLKKKYDTNNKMVAQAEKYIMKMRDSPEKYKKVSAETVKNMERLSTSQPKIDRIKSVIKKLSNNEIMGYIAERATAASVATSTAETAATASSPVDIHSMGDALGSLVAKNDEKRKNQHIANERNRTSAVRNRTSDAIREQVVSDRAAAARIEDQRKLVERKMKEERLARKLRAVPDALRAIKGMAPQAPVAAPRNAWASGVDRLPTTADETTADEVTPVEPFSMEDDEVEQGAVATQRAAETQRELDRVKQLALLEKQKRRARTAEDDDESMEDEVETAEELQARQTRQARQARRAEVERNVALGRNRQTEEAEEKARVLKNVRNGATLFYCIRDKMAYEYMDKSMKKQFKQKHEIRKNCKSIKFTTKDKLNTITKMQSILNKYHINREKEKTLIGRNAHTKLGSLDDILKLNNLYKTLREEYTNFALILKENKAKIYNVGEEILDDYRAPIDGVIQIESMHRNAYKMPKTVTDASVIREHALQRQAAQRQAAEFVQRQRQKEEERERNRVAQQLAIVKAAAAAPVVAPAPIPQEAPVAVNRLRLPPGLEDATPAAIAEVQRRANTSARLAADKLHVPQHSAEVVKDPELYARMQRQHFERRNMNTGTGEQAHARSRDMLKSSGLAARVESVKVTRMRERDIEKADKQMNQLKRFRELKTQFDTTSGEKKEKIKIEMTGISDDLVNSGIKPDEISNYAIGEAKIPYSIQEIYNRRDESAQRQAIPDSPTRGRTGKRAVRTVRNLQKLTRRTTRPTAIAGIVQRDLGLSKSLGSDILLAQIMFSLNSINDEEILKTIYNITMGLPNTNSVKALNVSSIVTTGNFNGIDLSRLGSTEKIYKIQIASNIGNVIDIDDLISIRNKMADHLAKP
jgi:hypothetical protein